MMIFNVDVLTAPWLNDVFIKRLRLKKGQTNCEMSGYWGEEIIVLDFDVHITPILKQFNQDYVFIGNERIDLKKFGYNADNIGILNVNYQKKILN